MVRCKICSAELEYITQTHLKKHNITIEEYLKKFNLTSDMLITNTIKEECSDISNEKKSGKNNPTTKIETNNTTELWDCGVYDKRVNKMIDGLKDLHPDYKPEIHTSIYTAEHNWTKFLANFQSIKECNNCGSSQNIINIHHIDENHKNFLPSNLEPLCDPCHSALHYKFQKLPFITIGRTFSFAGAHFLPEHSGKCKHLHGHEWKIEIQLLKRIHPKTKMVMDFGDLKKIINKYIISQVDHNFLNNILYNPTAENLLIWTWETLMFDAKLKGIEKIKIWETSNSVAELNSTGMLSIFKNNIEDYLAKYQDNF